jgi:hypothetical protein
MCIRYRTKRNASGNLSDAQTHTDDLRAKIRPEPIEKFL